MKISKENAIRHINDEIAGASHETINALLEHFAYSIADIQSWDELTDAEKKIMPKEVFEKLTFAEDKDKHSMVKEDKELLFKDLSAKIPYNTKP